MKKEVLILIGHILTVIGLLAFLSMLVMLMIKGGI